MIMEKKKLLKKEIILDGFKQNYVVESMINNVDGFINLLTSNNLSSSEKELLIEIVIKDHKGKIFVNSKEVGKVLINNKISNLFKDTIFNKNSPQDIINFVCTNFENYGLFYFNNKLYNDAIINFNKILKLNKKNINIYLYLAKSYYYLNNYNDAIINYKKMIDLNPKKIDPYLELGHIYYDNKQYNVAFPYFIIVTQLYKKAGKTGKTLAEVYLKLGYICFCIKYNTNVKKILEKLFSINSNTLSDSDAYAKHFLKKSIKNNPNIPASYFMLGDILFSELREFYTKPERKYLISKYIQERILNKMIFSVNDIKKILKIPDFKKSYLQKYFNEHEKVKDKILSRIIKTEDDCNFIKKKFGYDTSKYLLNLSRKSKIIEK